MAETTAVPGGPDPAADAGPRDAVPPSPRVPADEHPPGPAALYEPPAAPPAPAPDRPPVQPPAAPTGWTLTGMPAVGAPIPGPTPAPASGPGSATATPLPFAVPGVGGLGTAPRGRILVVEGGYGNAGRRTWGRGGPAQAPVLSAMLAAVSPQVLLAADAVDAVHLPGASDPQTVLAHLRAAARHPGPLLVHLGGHLLADKRGGQLHLTLRDSKPGSIRQDGLPWQAVAAELSHRPADWQTLVIADLSADPSALPQLQGAASPLTDGIPLWAVVSPDPEQIGTFTRALIEALHGGRPGAGDVLAPEQLHQQVYSVLRPDVVIVATHAPDRPVFRNTARRADSPVASDAVPVDLARPAAVMPQPTEPRDALVEPPAPTEAPVPEAPVSEAPAPEAQALSAAMVSLIKPGVPPTPLPPAHPVSLLKQLPDASSGVTLRKPAPADAPEEGNPQSGVTLAKPAPPVAAPVAAPVVDELEELLEAVSAQEAAEDPHDAALPQTTDEAEDALAAAEMTIDEPEDDFPAVEVTADEPQEAAAEEVAVEPDEAAAEDEAPADAPAPTPAPAAPQPRADYRETLGRIVRSADAGDHAAATDLAFALELEAIAEHGAVSEPVLQVRQVRAHVCRLAGKPALAADIYREVALTLLRSQGADHPETQQAATNAEACWRAIPDRAEAIRIAPEIIELRAYLPGPDGRKLRAAERYLAQLAAAAVPVAGNK
ncbi:hypothetical protein F7Q99_23695 [Streptomyces kaniharaensis]|uniref:Tetratricopeptide repeat protein n=1 Tax=Streptomyces kaniharaensis TaxID=212423 RepID=A0A6N7KUB3_9ACTN|nr:hypothetical protein [Streptomyces kaniharaensis]MQS15186.1 hypothetical protein [Streptomyces kaniharaensis]